jgi:hypothetical protein
MRVASAILCIQVLISISLSARAADVVVYDDALSPNFLDYSYSGGSVVLDFASTTHVHSGSHAISFAANGFDALKLANNTQTFDTSANPALHFWFYGTTAQCQALDFILERNNGGSDITLGSAQLSSYANCAGIVAGQWLAVTIDVTAAPIAYTGTYDRISLFNRNGTPFGPVYLDDLSLGTVAPDNIFANGFESSGAAAGTIQIDHDAPACIGNLVTERYTWSDALGRSRAATFSHNNTATNAQREGELCEYTYHTDAATVRDVKSLDASGAGGFGYVVSHLENPASASQIGQDDSPLGLQFTGNYANLLNGRHHALLRYTLNYPRYYCTEDGNGNCTSATTTYQMPVTIDWLIATGRDNPLWSVTLDLNGAPDNAISADSRAPYGDMAFDGAANGGFGDTVMGVAWGDHYKFTSTGASPLTFNSSWNWSQPNTIPYVYLWTQNVDAEMGIVQSEDITKQDAGGYFGQQAWTHTSADAGGPGRCSTTPFSSGNYVMPCDFNWPYQSINYAIGLNSSTNDKRLAWGAEFGFLGQTSYSGNDGSTIPVPFKRESYSTYVVLHKHSAGATAAQIAQVENAMSSTMSASVGTLKTSGPAGVGRSDTRNFLPVGYNRVYGTWEVNASGGVAAIALNAAGSGLLNPMFIVHNHANALPAGVTLDGAALTADVDYFATVDPGNADHADTRVWITVNRNWIGSHTLAVQ